MTGFTKNTNDSNMIDEEIQWLLYDILVEKITHISEVKGKYTIFFDESWMPCRYELTKDGIAWRS